MIYYFYVHVPVFESDLLVMGHRMSEVPNEVVIDRIVRDGKEIEEVAYLVDTYHTSIEIELSRKLSIKRKQLSIVEKHHVFI